MSRTSRSSASIVSGASSPTNRRVLIVRRDALAVHLELRSIRLDGSGCAVAQHQHIGVVGLAAAFGIAASPRPILRRR